MKTESLPARLLKWTLRAVAGAALLCAALALAARAPFAARLAAEQTARRLSSVSGREARVAAASVSLLPPGVRLRGVEVAGAAGGFETPSVSVSEAEASLSLLALLRGEVVVDVVEADGVVVRWEGRSTPAPPRPRREGPRRRLTLGRIALRNGTLLYRGTRAPFTLDAREIDATASSIPCEGPLCLDGAARAGPFEVVYEDHRLAGEALSATFHLGPDRFDVERFSVRGASFRGAGDASWGLGPGGAAGMNVSLGASGEAAASLLGEVPIRARSISLTAALAVKDGRVEASGEGVLEGLTHPGLADAARAEGTFHYREGTLTSDVRALGVVPRLAGLDPSGATEATARITRGPGGEGAARIEVRPVLLHDLLARLDPRLPRADVLTRTEGEITWRSRDPRSLGGSLRIAWTPFRPGAALESASAEPAPRAGDGRPSVGISGSALLDLGPDEVGVRDGALSASGIEARFSGRIDRREQAADLDVTLDRVELRPALEALGALPAAALALETGLDGPVAGRVRLRTRPGSARAEGRLEGDGLTMTPHGIPSGPFAASAEWTYGGRIVSVSSLHVAGDGWSADGSLRLDAGRPHPLRAAALAVRDLPADLLWPAAGLTAIDGGRLTGKADFDLDAAGAREGDVGLSLRGARLSGVTTDEIRLDGAIRGALLEVETLRILEGTNLLEARGSVDVDRREGSLDVTAQDLELGPLVASIAPRAGEAAGWVDLSGTLRLSGGDVGFEGRAEGRGAAFRGVEIGSLAAEIRRDAGGTWTHVQAPDAGVTARLRLPPGGEAPLEIDAVLSDLSLDRIRPLVPSGSFAGLAGKASGRIWGTIPVSDPLGADLDARIESLTLTAGSLELMAAEGALLTLRGGELWLGGTRVTGPGTDLTLSGVFDLRAGAAGAGSLTGYFDARILALAVPEVKAEGRVEVTINASASSHGLVYGGRLRTEAARLDYPNAPTPLENLKITADIAPDGSVKIPEVSFTFCGGEVAGEGEGRLSGLEMPLAEIRLRGTNMRAEPLPRLTLLFDGAATIVKEGDSGRVSGRLDVVRAIYTQEFELEGTSALGRARVVPAERARPAGPLFALDLDIVAPSEVWVRNRTALLEGSARLRITGALTRPEVTGRITVFDGGSFRFRDVTYRTEGGGIDFDDPDVIDPLLDLTARTQVREYEITLHVTGRYSRPRFELSSEPSLPQRDIVSLLVTGATYLESVGQDMGAGFLAEENVGQYLTAPLAETLQNSLGRLLNLTSLQIEPQLLNGRADPTARLTLTKRVSPEVLVVYSNNLGASQEQVYQFVYDLSRAWQLLGTRNLDGSLSGDLRFRHRWGGPSRTRATAPAAEGPPEGPAWRALEAGGAEISRIDVEGAGDADPSDLRKALKLRTGRPYTRADALEGRENLRAWMARHSHPIADVRLTVRPVLPGPEADRQGVHLLYEVAPGPKVDVEIMGVHGTRSLEKVVLESFERALEGGALPESGERTLQDHLGSKGYAGAAVRRRFEASPGRLAITYEIDRGPKVSVRDLRFDGSAAVPQEEIRRAMATREDRWNTSGLLRPNLLRSDVEAIRAVYLSHGYLDARVAEPVVTLTPDRKGAEILIRIDEGRPWRVGEIAIEGASSYPAESLREATRLAPGTVLRPSALDAAQEHVRDILDANGFNTVRVRAQVEGPPESARVRLVVEEGPRQVLDRIALRGNVLTDDRVLRREIPLKPGDPVSRSGMLEAQRRLYSLGVFRSVDVRSSPDPEDPNKARLLVDVVEGDPLLTAWGGGYNTEEGVQGFAQIGHNNVFGSSRSASLILNASAVTRRAQFSLGDHRLFGIPFDGLVTAFWELQDRESFDQRRRGGAVQLTRKPSREVTLLGRYNVQDVHLSEVDIKRARLTDLGLQDVRLANVAGSAARDTRDDILSPSRGAFTSADLRLYLAAVGSGEQFARLSTTASGFRSVAEGVVLAASARLGWAKPFASTNRVHLSERFFAGGDTTLRGFEADEAGPLDVSTLEPLGGELSVLFNTELRFPLYGALKGVLFYDAGNVFHRPAEFRWSGTGLVEDFVNGVVEPVGIQDGLRHVVGAGVRFDTPLGPLRIEYGRKLDRRFGPQTFRFGAGTVTVRRDESPYEIFLSIGQAF